MAMLMKDPLAMLAPLTEEETILHPETSFVESALIKVRTDDGSGFRVQGSGFRVQGSTSRSIIPPFLLLFSSSRV